MYENRKENSRDEKYRKTKEDSRKGYIRSNGPIGKVVIFIIEFVIEIVKRIFGFIWTDLIMGTSKFVYNALFSEFKGVFAGKDKNGDCVNTSFMRYIITLIIPPMGIFMSKGLAGWPSLLICSILCFVNFFIGVIYAFIVTFNNKYSDRYQQKQLQLIEENKKKRMGTSAENSNKYSLWSIIVSVIILGLFVIGFIKLAKFIEKIHKK